MEIEPCVLSTQAVLGLLIAKINIVLMPNSNFRQTYSMPPIAAPFLASTDVKLTTFLLRLEFSKILSLPLTGVQYH